MGGFEPKPVREADLVEARRVSRLYNQQQMDSKIPIRPMTHAIIHMPDDCENFQVQSESISAYVFENFMRFFRNVFTSGYMPLEQLINRLYERYKYRLNTTEDGSIINNKVEFDIQVKKWEMKHSNQKIVTEHNNLKSEEEMKSITFPNFKLTNRFPNNVVLMRNNAVVVVDDISQDPQGRNIFKIFGPKFDQVYPAFRTPYESAKYFTFVATKIRETGGEYNVNSIKCKLFVTPLDVTLDLKEIPDILKTRNQKWFVTPLRHTIS